MKRDLRYWLFVAGLVLVFLWIRHDGGEAPSPAAEAPAAAGPGGLADYETSKVRVTMYSLTTCPYCKAMHRELTARNIPFVEYFIDAEPGRQRELTSKLEHAGFRPGAIGTPILEVNGVMLPNNPSIRTVLKQLQQG
jgi:glutaredoxin